MIPDNMKTQFQKEITNGIPDGTKI